ncbi:MAG: hypothetical protein QF778_05170, partial [SAR324 cluster bacterium]|nr:hypothetical protein [SAR324 cluster bacterium]
MKQSEWKEQLESIEAEMHRLGQAADASTVLRQFGTRLSTTIHHFFAETTSFVPDAALTGEQQAFMHSLQLYDLRSVMRLVVNYDASKGLKVVLPGIEKSYRSLMVIQQLERFTNNSLESSALDSYKFRLEEALSRVLKCRREDLYKEDILAEKMVLVSGATQALLNKFFTERLRTLFSSNYRAYLMLKNRYFLNRLKQFRKNPDNYKAQQSRLTELVVQFENHEELRLEQVMEQLDFREIEQLVKAQILQTAEREIVQGDSAEKDNSDLVLAEESLVSSNLSVDQTKTEQQISFEPLAQENSKDNISAYEDLCTAYAEPLEKLSASFSPVPECSSPYFRSRVEDYYDEFANFFRQLHGGNLQVIAASHNFTQELLLQRGQEYKASERWGVVAKNNQDEDSVYFRSTDEKVPFVDRKAEWSMLIQASLPFMIQLPVEKAKSIEIEKDKLCVFQIGTAFFDQGHKNKRDEYPDVFFKLMFGGHLLSGKNAVIYVEQDPYFTTTLEQMWHCRGLVYLFIMAISHRFALELSSAMQEFLVD